MISIFLRHEFKAFWRAKNAGKSLAVQIIMGVLIIIIMLYVLLAGFFLDKLLLYYFPKDDVVFSFFGFILLYFLFDLISRMQLQELPTLRVQPYLQLPVKRNALAQYLALTSLLSAFNFLPFLLFLPFIFKIILVKSGWGIVAAFVVSMLGLTMFNNYLALYIKRKANLNGWVNLIATGVLVLFIMGDFQLHIYSIRAISYSFFGRLGAQPVLAVLPIVLAIVIYYINFLYLKSNLYLEELRSKKNVHKSSTEYPLLNRFGIVGDLVANEIKLIIRNKRPNSVMKMGVFFLLYGLFFYLNPGFHMNDPICIFAGTFLTGMVVLNYGQFMYSWQAAHFDGLMVSKMKFADFLKQKYFLLTLFSTTAFILTTPYVYFGWRVLLIHFVMFIWNIGVNTTIVLFFANRNTRRLDLSKGAAMNWQGIGASQWLLSLPSLLAPFVIYVPCRLLGYPNLGLVLLAAIGLVFLFMRGFLVKKLEEDFYKQKYKIAEGFREK